MRMLFLLPVIVFCGAHRSAFNISSLSRQDTSIIVHLLDGNTAEWPAEKFKTDKETKMEYAVDHDNQTLFLVISISDITMQKRVMQDGLNLYVDIKGKKKENKGIEFPVIMENLASVENMKIFGFSNTEPFLQNIKTEGTANIAMAWDSANVIHIEYNIPLKMLEETSADLNNKKISIGWKLKESEVPIITSQAPQPVTTTTRLVAVPAGSQPSAIRNPPNLNNVRNVNNNPAPQPNSNKGQSFWTSYTIIFWQ